MAKINKLTKNGQTIYPATTTDSVLHPNLKVSASKLVGEVNVSAIFPTGGIDGGNKYTLETAIAKIPQALRQPGLHVSFVNKSGKFEEYIATYASSQGDIPPEEELPTVSWEQGSVSINGLLGDSNRIRSLATELNSGSYTVSVNSSYNVVAWDVTVFRLLFIPQRASDS